MVRVSAVRVFVTCPFAGGSFYAVHINPLSINYNEIVHRKEQRASGINTIS